MRKKHFENITFILEEQSIFLKILIKDIENLRLELNEKILDVDDKIRDLTEILEKRK